MGVETVKDERSEERHLGSKMDYGKRKRIS